MSQQPPVRPSMESVDGKYRRAKYHLDGFRDQVRIFESLNSHEIFAQDDPQASQYVFKIRNLKPADPEWGYVVGDGIHNLRSALDHLVFQLAILGQGRQLTDSEARSCSFPIYFDPSKFPDPSKSGPIHLLRSGEQTRITELQPFNASDPSIWGLSHESIKFHRMDPHWVPTTLDGIGILDNTDKHRTVHPTWRFAEWFNTPAIPPPFRPATANADTLKDNAEVGRWAYDSPRPPLPPDMDMNRYFPLGIALGDPPHMESAQEMIDRAMAAVGIVLELFRPCIEAGKPPLPLASIPER